jgi:hypothetical protein
MPPGSFFKQFLKVHVIVAAAADGHGQLTGTQPSSMVAVPKSTVGQLLPSWRCVLRRLPAEAPAMSRAVEEGIKHERGAEMSRIKGVRNRASTAAKLANS